MAPVEEVETKETRRYESCQTPTVVGVESRFVERLGATRGPVVVVEVRVAAHQAESNQLSKSTIPTSLSEITRSTR